MFLKNTILLITKGDYSTYGEVGIFLVLKDFDCLDKIYMDDKKREKASPQETVMYLLNNGYIKEICYNKLSLSDFNEIKEAYIRENNCEFYQEIKRLD